MDIFKEIQKEESNKGSLVHNWHCQELERFITELIKKDRKEQLSLYGVVSCNVGKEKKLAKMKWIKTKKQLPKNDDFVLVYNYNPANLISVFEIAYYDADEKSWFNNEHIPVDDYGFFVLYWQKLPNKPK